MTQKYTNEELKAMSGAETTASLPKLNQILINGDAKPVKGKKGELVRPEPYYRKRLLLSAERDTKPEEDNIGSDVTVVFTNVRRKLIERGDGGEIIRSTSEHNRYDSVVTLYHKDGEREVGIAKDFRADDKYPGLKTVQYVYAMHGGELVRVVIKGSALGSKVKKKETMSFYDYMKTFKGDEQIFDYETILGTELEEGQQDYFTVTFERGNKLSEAEREAAIEKMVEIRDICKAYDANSKMEVKEETEPANAEDEFADGEVSSETLPEAKDPIDEF